MGDDDQIRLFQELRAAVLTYTAMVICNSAEWDGTTTDTLDRDDRDLTVAALINIARKGHELVTAVQGCTDRTKLN